MPDFSQLEPGGFRNELEKIPVTFDAGGDADATRPSVPSTTTVIWFNTPSEPTNLGAFDMWEDVS